MALTAIDWAIVAAYFILSTGIGFAFTMKGGESLSEYFISARNMPLSITLSTVGCASRAIIKIDTNSLGLRVVRFIGTSIPGQVVAVRICFVSTVAYSAGAGMWAVLWTDLVQFVIKMTAVIILAVYAVRAVGGMDALKAGLTTHFGDSNAALSVLPIKMTENGIEAYAWMPL